MKAIRVHEFGSPEVMRLEEVADPRPGSDEIAVNIHAAGVNPVDTYIRSGLYPAQSSLPYTPGLDAAGIVESVGSGIDTFSAGDRVYIAGSISGTYAEKALCRISQAHRLPGNVSFSQGAALGVPYCTAYYALFYRAHALPGETVLIHGASGGGTAAVQLARNAGMKVIGTGGSDKGRRLALKQGAHHVLDHRESDHLEQAIALTGGSGVDIILEMLADANLGKDLGALAAGLENGTLRPVIGRERPLAEAARAHHDIIETNAYGKIVLKP